MMLVSELLQSRHCRMLNLIYSHVHISPVMAVKKMLFSWNCKAVKKFRIMEIMSKEPDKTRLISLSEAAEIYGFNAQYLSQLARRGRLKAQKIGYTWITTPQDVENYIRDRKITGFYRNDIQLDD